MRLPLYAGLVFGLVPVQATLLRHVSVAGVGPDLCLVAACLVGFLGGEIEGLLVGLALGFVQDLFSAGSVWLNVMTKGAIGLLAGLVGRHVTNATPTIFLRTLVGLSGLSGLIFLVLVRSGVGWADYLAATYSILLPETVFNAAVGAGAYWLIAGRMRREQVSQGGLAGFVR